MNYDDLNDLDPRRDFRQQVREKQTAETLRTVGHATTIVLVGFALYAAYTTFSPQVAAILGAIMWLQARPR